MTNVLQTPSCVAARRLVQERQPACCNPLCTHAKSAEQTAHLLKCPPQPRQQGMVAAFVSGGIIPSALRGTTNGIRFQIVDWYSTFCFLAGASPSDDSPLKPLPVDPLHPSKDIYGNHSWFVIIPALLMRPT